MIWSDLTTEQQQEQIDKHVALFDVTPEFATGMLVKAHFSCPVHDKLRSTLEIACQIRDEQGWEAVEEWLAEQIQTEGVDEIVTWSRPLGCSSGG